jgi:hypothetical protein
MQAEPVDVGAKGLARCAFARYRTRTVITFNPARDPKAMR